MFLGSPNGFFKLQPYRSPPQCIIQVALFPSLTFWGLDAFYLRQERLFRKLYDELRKLSDEKYEKADPFSMSTKKHSREVASWFRTLWAPTILGLHGVVVAAVIVVIVVLSR